MQLEPKGYLLHTNSEGYFKNPFSYEDINRDSQEILQKVIDLLLKHNKERIDSIYVRGSVASNTKINNYSDIDLIVIYQDSLQKIPNTIEWNNQIFRLDIDQLEMTSFQDLYHHFGTHFMLKTQSVHLYGKNRIPEIQDFQASKKTASKFGHNLPKLITKTKIFVEEEPQQLANITQWISRAIIRGTITLFMDREHIYTRDLVYCYQYFAKYYPEHESQMNLLVEQALQPTLSKEELIAFLDDFGMNLAGIIEEYHKRND